MQTKNDSPLDWRKFPQFEQVFTEAAFEPFLAKMEKSCESLREIAAGSDKTDSTRARAALAAYGRALELTKEVIELRATSKPAGR